MAPVLFTYTLPTLQLMCSLIASGDPRIGSETSTIREGALSKINTAPAPLTYTLPEMQVMCNLIAMRDPSIVETTSGTIEIPSTTPSAPSLPPGYKAYPEFGAAYKVSNETVSWDVAKDRCAREGAYLAAIDTFEKIKLVRSQQPSAEKPNVFVGFYSRDDDATTWYSVYTGLPVASVPWKPGEPSGPGSCVMLWDGERGLDRYTCSNPGAYVCEIRYL